MKRRQGDSALKAMLAAGNPIPEDTACSDIVAGSQNTEVLHGCQEEEEMAEGPAGCSTDLEHFNSRQPQPAQRFVGWLFTCCLYIGGGG